MDEAAPAGRAEPVALADPDAARSIAAAWLTDVDELTDRLLSAIFTDNPDWTDYDPVTRDDLRDGCRGYLARILELLADRCPPGIEDDAVVARIGEHRAEQGVPLEALLRTFRLGGRIVWEALLERSTVDQVAPAALGAAATAMWTVVDGLSSALSTSYRRTQLEQLRRDDQHRHALVEGILAGRAADGGFGRRVADQLEIPRDGSYLVVVADLSPDGTAALRAPRTTLAAVGLRSVWHARTDTLVGLIPTDGHDVRGIRDRLRPLARGRVAAVPAEHGLADVPLAHRLAALTLQAMPGTAVGLASIEDRYPEALILRSPEIGRRLAATWLGPIVALPDRERDVLLTTLTVWLDADRSAAVAAERLYCHRNTVLNRLNRIAALIGRDLTGRPAFVELSLALTALGLQSAVLSR